MVRTRTALGPVVVAALLAAWCAPAAALEAGWRGEFAAAGGAPVDPKEPLRIALPADIDQETLQWLSVELDTMDVTPILALEGTAIVVRPPRPLASGTHRLSLAQYDEGGGVVDRGSWTFKVGQAVAYQARADGTLSATYRADTRDIPEESLPGSRTTADGSLRVEASAGTASWEVSGNADGVWTSQPAEGLDHFEGGNFLATVRAGPVTAQAGQLDPHAQSLVISSFERRGVSLSYVNPGQELQARGFALRTVPVAGFNEGLGIGDPEYRLLGGALTVRPFRKHGEWLALTGIYLDARQGTDPGAAVVDETSVSAGDAWSVGFVSGLLNQRLRLRGEYAATRFDPDGEGALDEEPDEAYGGAAVWDLLRDARLAGAPLTWAVGAEYQRTGPSFKSLANAGLPTDLQMQKAFTRLDLGGMSAEIVAGTEHDNVESDPAVATGETDLLGAVLGYSPTLVPGGRAQAILGQPRVDLAFQQTRDRTTDLPAESAGAMDRRVREWSAALGSGYGRWDWRAGYRSRREEDLTGAAADSTSETADGGLGFRLGERVAVGLRGQLVRDENLGTGLERTGTLVGGDLALVLVKDRLTARVAHQDDRREATDGSEDSRTRTTDFVLDLTLRQAANNWPGVVLSLKGQQQQIDDRVNDENDKEPFQVFLAVNIGWPASTSGTWR